MPARGCQKIARVAKPPSGTDELRLFHWKPQNVGADAQAAPWYSDGVKVEYPKPSSSDHGVKCVIRRPASTVRRGVTFQESWIKPSTVLYEISLRRLKFACPKLDRLPSSMS